MAEDKRFPDPAAVMATPQKTKWKVAEQIMGSMCCSKLQHLQLHWNMRGVGVLHVSERRRKVCTFIEFVRYVTSSILQSDNVNPACSVAVVLQRRTCIRENRHLFAYTLMCVRIRNHHH